MEITGLRPGDVRPLIALWDRALPADQITIGRFRDLVLLDANFDPEGLRVAREGDRILGAAYAVRRTNAASGADLEPGRGWLLFFFVDPTERRRGLGRALAEETLDWLRGHRVREVFFSSYTPNYLLPGLDRAAYPEAGALLDALGFTRLYTAAAMDRSLVGYAMPDDARRRLADLTGEGWSFGPPSVDELVPLVRLAVDHFGADWARALRESITGGLPLERIVVAREPGGTLAGWAMHAAYENALERFGPFGVHESRRGKGIGKVLLHLTLERMRAAGAHSAWFLWTGEQSPAGQLYLNSGFAVTRRFDVMRAEL